MERAFRVRVERDYPDRCHPCFCNKEFGRFEMNRFYVCDIEYGYGMIAVYRPKRNGYEKVTFDERIFNLHFSVCRDRATPKTASIITKIAVKFHINLCTKVNISEDGNGYYYVLKMSISQNGGFTIYTSGCKDKKFHTKEQAYRVGIKDAKKVLTTCIMPNQSVCEKLLTYFEMKTVSNPSKHYYTYFNAIFNPNRH